MIVIVQWLIKSKKDLVCKCGESEVEFMNKIETFYYFKMNIY